MEIIFCSIAGVADAQILSSDFMKKRDCDENFKSVYRARKSDIAGLSSRADNPLEFLGLYGTDHKACYRHDIPASLVSFPVGNFSYFPPKQLPLNQWA